MKKIRRRIKEFVIHCSATPEGKNYSVEQVRQWHLARGWSDIGYHYIIQLDGKIESGRPLEVVGAHAKGHNRWSIGICYIGGLDHTGRAKDTRTPEQKRVSFARPVWSKPPM